MHKLGWISICLLIIAIPALAQQTQQTYTEQELSVIEAIKAQNRTLQESAPSMQAAPDPTQEADDAIQLSDQTKQQALEQPAEKAASDETGEEPAVSDASNKKCFTVAFIDIDVAEPEDKEKFQSIVMDRYVNTYETADETIAYLSRYVRGDDGACRRR